jgi:putative transposase
VPRIPRGQQGGYAYHVINRGNGRGTVFHKTQDYEAFLSLLVEAKKRHQVKMSGFCLMPNHFHLVLEPPHQTALSQFMQWLLTSHVRRYHKHYGSSGHIWQGRFKSFPIQRNEHLITVLRYVLQNPVRAGLSSTPREWLWSSLRKPQLADPCAVSNKSNRVITEVTGSPEY